MSNQNTNPKANLKKILTIGVFGDLLIYPNMKAFANVYVRGHYRLNSTYVDPHYRTSPNKSNFDNWSYYGNTNPRTGQKGYNRGW